MSYVLIMWVLLTVDPNPVTGVTAEWTPVEVAAYTGVDAEKLCNNSKDFFQGHSDDSVILFECHVPAVGYSSNETQSRYVANSVPATLRF